MSQVSVEELTGNARADTLAFVDNSFSEKLLSCMARMSISPGECVFLTLCEETFLKLQDRGFSVFFLQDLFEKEDLLVVEEHYLKMVRSVFYPEGKSGGPFDYDGAPLGYMVQDVVEPYFVRAFRNIFCVSRALDKFKHERVAVIGTSGLSRAARLVLDSMGVDYISCRESLLHGLKWRARRFWRERKNRWLRIPFREFVYEPFQYAFIVCESYIHNAILRLSGTGMPRIGRKLLVCSADRHSYGVGRQLMESGMWDLTGCGSDFRFKRTNLGGAYSLEGFAGISGLAGTLGAFFYFFRLWRLIDDDEQFRGRFLFMDVNYWDIVREAIRNTLLTVFPFLYLVHVTSLEFFRKRPDSFLLIPSDRPAYYRSLSLAARRAGIKSMIIQHGILGRWDCHRTFEAGYYAVWGNIDLERFRDYCYGNESEGVYVTGMSDNSVPQESGKTDRESLCASLGLPFDKKIVLVFAQWVRDQYLPLSDMHDFRMIDSVVEAVSSLDPEGSHVAVKPHPSGDSVLLREFCARKSKVLGNVSFVTGRIEELLEVAHACVSQPTSTVVLQSIIAEKPVIVFDCYIKREITPFVRMGAALPAEDATSMEEALRMLYHNRDTKDALHLKAREYLKYAVHKPDGMGAKRIAHLVEYLMEGTEPPRFL